MRQSLLIFLLPLVSLTLAENSAKVRIHENGINYITGIAREILEKEVSRMKIPDQETKTGKIRAWFTGITLNSVDLPRANVSIQDDSLILTTAEGSVSGRLNVKATCHLIAKITTRGNADIRLWNVNSRVVLKWKKGTEVPQLEIASCQGKLETFKIKFHGNVIIWIVNQFSGKIGRSIRDSVSKQICPNMGKLIERVNKELANLPSLFPVTKEGKRIFSIQYEDLKTEVGKNFVDVSANALFHFNNKTCRAVIQKDFPETPTTNMLTAWGSQGVLDCLLQSFHESKQLQYLITNKAEKFRPYLRTACPSRNGGMPKCVGDLFSELDKKFPNRTVDILIYSSTPPNVTIGTNGIRIQGFSDLNITLDNIFLAKFEMNITAVVVPRLKKSLLNGTVKIEGCTIRLTESAIGPIVEEKTIYLGPIAAAGTTYILRPIVENGILIPGYMGLQLANSSSASLLDGYLRTDIDITKI